MAGCGGEQNVALVARPSQHSKGNHSHFVWRENTHAHLRDDLEGRGGGAHDVEVQRLNGGRGVRACARAIVRGKGWREQEGEDGVDDSLSIHC